MANPKQALFLPLAAALLGGALAAHAQTLGGADTLRLLAASAQDEVATQLRAPAPGRLATDGLERVPVSVSWALDPAQVLELRPQPFVRESREYWIDASEGELQRGVSLALSAPGAVIRLSPHGGNRAAALDPRDIQLRTAGRHLSGDAAIRSIVDEDALRAAGMDVPGGSIALRLADSLAADRVELAVPSARGGYLVHVHEPASTVVFNLGAERDSVGGGESLRVRATLAGGLALDRVGGLVSAPDGFSQPIEFVRQPDGSHVADVVPSAEHAGGPGLWEVHAFASAGGKAAIPRDAKSAFAVSLPVARFDGRVERDANAARMKELTLRLGVETRAASRYQVSAVLYGTAADGRLRPAAVAQSAAWLAEGRGLLELRYDAASLASTALGPPWELRDLRLVNQADMGLLERRERALVVAR